MATQNESHLVYISSNGKNLTEARQVDLLSSQLVAQQYYQVIVKAE